MIANTRKRYKKHLDRYGNKTQKYKILRKLIDDGEIRQDEAWHFFRISRLGARISELRKDGVPIETLQEFNPDGTPKPFKTYRIN